MKDEACKSIGLAGTELSRRQTLQIAGTGAAGLIAPGIGTKKAKTKKRGSTMPAAGTLITSAPDLIVTPNTPDEVVLALHRIAFGPRPGDVDRVRSIGLEAYLHEQLHPVDSDDDECDQHLADFTMRIAYPATKQGKDLMPAIDEDRPFTCLNQSSDDLYKLVEGQNRGVNYQEVQRPIEEVKAAKIIRATYSKWQLREVMTDFWHNHFSIDAYIDDPINKVMFPIYDRDVIRKNSLGNFREFIGLVAKSQPMLVYLNNYSSKASPANENYARELFELHTLGAEHYYNDLYQEWSKVPGSAIGKPEGYIDQDVYEAARAFTGWTIANGAYGRGERLPSNGEFYYYDAWHDPYQKRVLATDFDPYQPPMADGERVLDLVAFHPGTAQFICKKICKRLVSPNPPESLVQKAVHTWTTYQKDPVQISRVIHTIVTSDEFKTTYGKGMKLPFEATIAFFRATESEVHPDGGLFGMLAQMGESMFNWPTPNGRPYDASFWSGTMGMVSRWNSMQMLTYGRPGVFEMRDPLPMPVGAGSFDEVCRYWEDRMLGRHLDSASHATLVAHISSPFPTGVPDSGSAPYIDRTKELISLIAMTPDFHIR